MWIQKIYFLLTILWVICVALFQVAVTGVVFLYVSLIFHLRPVDCQGFVHLMTKTEAQKGKTYNSSIFQAFAWTKPMLAMYHLPKQVIWPGPSHVARVKWWEGSGWRKEVNISKQLSNISQFSILFINIYILFLCKIYSPPSQVSKSVLSIDNIWFRVQDLMANIKSCCAPCVIQRPMI